MKNILNPETTTRPWGNFREFTRNEKCTVKIITIESGQAFSLQYHKKRKEFWKILKGDAWVTIGDEAFKAKVGDEFSILEEQKHRVEAPASEVEILEISFGEFDEHDVVRLEDRYGRV